VEPRDNCGRAVSPELVLVDPDLAARARAALPEHPWPAPVRIETVPRPEPRRRAPVAVTFWTFGLALVLLVFGLSLISTNDRPTFAADGEGNDARIPATSSTQARKPQPAKPKAALRKGSTQARKPQPAKRKTAPRTVERKGSARIRARRNPTPAAPPRAKTNARPTRRAASRRGSVRRGFRPARIFSWPPHAGASYYQVVFLRNGRPFYRTRTDTARLQLPPRVRFTTGSYRWTVRPGIGDRLERPVVDSTFQVSGD
jgi:hypothetical protein